LLAGQMEGCQYFLAWVDGVDTQGDRQPGRRDQQAVPPWGLGRCGDGWHISEAGQSKPVSQDHDGGLYMRKQNHRQTHNHTRTSECESTHALSLTHEHTRHARTHTHTHSTHTHTGRGNCSALLCHLSQAVVSLVSQSVRAWNLNIH